MDERGVGPSFTVGDRVRVRLRPDGPQPHAAILNGCIGVVGTGSGSGQIPRPHRYTVYFIGNDGAQRGRYAADELELVDESAPC